MESSHCSIELPVVMKCTSMLPSMVATRPVSWLALKHVANVAEELNFKIYFI